MEKGSQIFQGILFALLFCSFELKCLYDLCWFEEGLHFNDCFKNIKILNTPLKASKVKLK